MDKVQLARDLTSGQADDIAAFLHSLTGKLPESLARVPVLPAAE
jgi:hypothetical protein